MSNLSKDREVDSKGNCSKCGGTHYGSYMCPMAESLQDEAINEGADIRKDSVRQARDTPCNALSADQVKRYDCTSGGAQFCNGCYTMEEDELGDYVRWNDYELLRAALRELVECKDLKERLNGWEAGSTQEMAAMLEEYESRKPEAWERARLLVTPKPQEREIQENVECCDLMDGDCCLPKGHEGECCDIPF